MKTHIALILAALAALVIPSAADTPDAILSDYRAKADPALEKVNATLEKATVPILAELVKTGDTAGAEEVKTQLKAKQSGDPVVKPHAKVASLFSLYDAARGRALEPAQKAAIARIDTMLASSDGKKIEIVEALGKVRAEIEAGRFHEPSSTFPPQWTYHLDRQMRPSGSIEFHPNGSFDLKISGRQTEQGKWKQDKKGDITLTLGKETFPMVVTNNEAVLEMSIGKRYLKTITDTP